MKLESALLRSLVGLADNLVADFDVVDLLTSLCDSCVESLDVFAAGVMIADPGGRLQVLASSSNAMRTLELLQLQSDEGPCVDAYRRGAPVVVEDLSAQAGRWRRFAPEALAAGIRSTHSLPMRLRGQTVGALNLFRVATGSLGDDVEAAQALADVATIAILQHRGAVNARELNDQLNHALNSRIVIEQAKGRVAEAANLDMDRSFERLRRHARRHNLRLADLAEDVVVGRVHPGALDPLPPRAPEA